MEEKIIAIDPGKFRIKAATGNLSAPQTADFRAKLYTLKDSEHFEPQGKSKLISYQGTQYILGDQGTDTDKSLKKDTILHKVGLMAALSDMVQDGDIINLTMGCPASIYKDKTSRQAYKNYMIDNGILSFETDNKHYEVTIANATVLPESSGAIYTFPTLFERKRTAVVDIGGLNLNFSVYNDMVLDPDSLNTSNFGGYELEKRVISIFSGHYGVALTRDDYEQIVANNGFFINGTLDPDSKGILTQAYISFIQDIPDIIRDFGYDLSLLNVVFLGGTSELLGERITSVIPHATIKSNITWSNVLGFLKYAQLKFGK